MDIVLGVSMATSAVRMVLLDDENSGGATVEEDGFDVGAADDTTTTNTPDQVISAILGTRQGAAEGGYNLTSTWVTWTDPVEAAVLRDALAARKVENVMLVSAFLAAAALARVVGDAIGYSRTALMFLEPDSATLAVVNCPEGAIVDVQTHELTSADSVAELTGMITDIEQLDARPDAVFLIGSGVDVDSIKPRLQTAITLPVTAPAEQDKALARGAALAAAHVPLLASSAAALTDVEALGAGAAEPDSVCLAYSAVSGEAADLTVSEEQDETHFGAEPDFRLDEQQAETKRFLVACAVLMFFIVGIGALTVALALVIRPTLYDRPNPAGNDVGRTEQASSVPQARPATPPWDIAHPVPAVKPPPNAAVAPPLPEAPPAPPQQAPPPNPGGGHHWPFHRGWISRHLHGHLHRH